MGFLAGFCWKESRSPRYSLGLGERGAVVTNDWCFQASIRDLDKLLFQMSTVLVHLKKKGVTRNFKEYSLNDIKNVLNVSKKRKSFINTLFHNR